MKRLRTILATLMAALTALVIAAPAMAGTITITPPSGLDASATNTYKIYKVFDAVGDGTNISYKLVSGKTAAPDGFVVDDAGNVYCGTVVDTATSTTIPVTIGGNQKYIEPTTTLSDTMIAAIANYVTEADLVATVTSTGSEEATATNLADGYYYITTSLGTVVTIDSTNHDAAVNDKNTPPTLDKKITNANSVDEDGKKALAQVGTDVEYTATITVGEGAKGYVFHDTMESTLAYNNDVKVYLGADGSTEVAATNYSTTPTAAGDTFTVTFNDDYTSTLAAGTILRVVYSAKITSDALTQVPAKNTAYLSYGDKNSNYKTPNSETETYNAKFTVTKKDGQNNALQGAGFVLKNAAGKYYKLNPAAGTTPATVRWVDSIDEATEYTSDADGAVTPFTGLPNGTYTLVEKTVPAGYNKAADTSFTVAEHDYTTANLEQSTTVVNQAGAELPSTGGMGTTILYIVGAVLVVGAGIALVARRRMASERY